MGLAREEYMYTCEVCGKYHHMRSRKQWEKCQKKAKKMEENKKEDDGIPPNAKASGILPTIL